MSDPYDVAIVGGGPAGLTAALWLGRYLHRVVLIDSGDPRNWETRGVNGFPGHPGITPAELRGKTRDECRQYGVELIDGFVLDEADAGNIPEVGVKTVAARTLMRTLDDKQTLARHVLTLAQSLRR